VDEYEPATLEGEIYTPRPIMIAPPD